MKNYLGDRYAFGNSLLHIFILYITSKVLLIQKNLYTKFV